MKKLLLVLTLVALASLAVGPRKPRPLFAYKIGGNSNLQNPA